MITQLDPQAKLDDSNDVTLVMKNRREIRANRQMLLTVSPFFSAILNSDMRENREGIIRLEHISDTAMRDALEFTHSGSVEITSTNVQDLIEAAEYLLLPKLKAVAEKFLEQTLSTSNWISVYYFAEKYRCDDRVVTQARNLILSNFEFLADSEDFLNLESRQVVQWISSDDIAVSSEDDVIKIILKWIEQNRKERQGKLEELFRHVRLDFASRDYLKRHVVTNKIVKRNSSCLKFVRQATKVNHSVIDNEFPQSPRNWQDTHLVVLAGKETLCYDPVKEKWYRLASSRPGELSFPHLVNLFALDGKLYVYSFWSPRVKVGTFTGQRYEPFCNRWDSLHWKSSHSHAMARLTAVAGKAVYAIDCSWTRTARPDRECYIMKYDVETNSWEQVSSFLLDDGRIGPLGACVVVLDNYLYLIGGGLYDSEDNTVKPIGYAGRYDIIGKRWEKIANMQQARFDACGTAARGNIFIAGGTIVEFEFRYHRGPTVATQTCEVYNVSTNEWQFITSLHAPRWGGSMVYLKGALYVVGGALFRDRLDSKEVLFVESYDFEWNTWKLKTKIPISNWNNITCKGSSLRVNKRVLRKSITKPLSLEESV